MRNRHAAGRSAPANPAGAPGKGSRRGNVKRTSCLQSTRVRGFAVATGAFLLVLATVYVFKVGAPSVVAPITEDDFAVLQDAIAKFNAATTVSGFIELSEAASHVGCSAELMMEQLVAAEEAADDDAGAHGIPVVDGHGVPRSSSLPPLQSKRVLQRYREQLKPVTNVLTAAADTSYDKLTQILRQEPGGVLPKALSSLPRTVFGWLATTTHLYSVVLTEYSLVQDDTSTHARALLRSVNLLSWAATSPHLFNWTGAPCEKSVLGVTKQWQRFCETSLSSRQATATRRAASFEELIALYPNYAPFRLHHAVLLIVRDGPALASSSSALRLIRTLEDKMNTYDAVDEVYAATLTLLEAFTTPVEQISRTNRERVAEALRTTMHQCDAFLGPSNGGKRFWPAPFEAEVRPPLFDLSQVQLLFLKLRLVLGPEAADPLIEGSCLPSDTQ